MSGPQSSSEANSGEPLHLVGLTGKIRTMRQFTDTMRHFTDKVIDDYNLNIDLGDVRPQPGPGPRVTAYHSPSIVQFYFVDRDTRIAGPNDGHSHDDPTRKERSRYIHNSVLPKPGSGRQDGGNEQSDSANNHVGRERSDRTSEAPDSATGSVTTATAQQQRRRSARASESEDRPPVDLAGVAFLNAMRQQRPSNNIRQAVIEYLCTFEKAKVTDHSTATASHSKPVPKKAVNAKQSKRTPTGMTITEQPFRSVEGPDGRLLGRPYSIVHGQQGSRRAGNRQRDVDEEDLYDTSRSPPRHRPRADEDEEEDASPPADFEDEAASGDDRRLQKQSPRGPGGLVAGTNGITDGDEQSETKDEHEEEGDGGWPEDGKHYGWQSKRVKNIMQLDIDKGHIIGEKTGGRTTRAGSQARSTASVSTTPASKAPSAAMSSHATASRRIGGQLTTQKLVGLKKDLGSSKTPGTGSSVTDPSASAAPAHPGMASPSLASHMVPRPGSNIQRLLLPGSHVYWQFLGTTSQAQGSVSTQAQLSKTQSTDAAKKTTQGKPARSLCTSPPFLTDLVVDTGEADKPPPQRQPRNKISDPYTIHRPKMKQSKQRTQSAPGPSPAHGPEKDRDSEQMRNAYGDLFCDHYVERNDAEHAALSPTDGQESAPLPGSRGQPASEASQDLADQPLPDIERRWPERQSQRRKSPDGEEPAKQGGSPKKKQKKGGEGQGDDQAS